MTYNDLLLSFTRRGFIDSVSRSAYRKYCRRNTGQKAVSPCEGGFNMHTVLGDSVDNKIAVYGVFEPGTSQLITALAPMCESLLDVGCNIGYFSCLFAVAQPRGKIFAVDPNPKMIRRAQENLQLNKIKNYCLLGYGIGYERDRLQLNIPQNRHSLSSFAYAPTQGGTVESIECDILPLWEVIDSYNIEKTFLKIDTEGYEHDVLKSISPKQFQNIRYIMFEHSFENISKTVFSVEDILSLEIFKHYDLYKVNEESVPLLKKETVSQLLQSRQFNSNVLMVHHSQRNAFTQLIKHNPALF